MLAEQTPHLTLCSRTTMRSPSSCFSSFLFLFCFLLFSFTLSVVVVVVEGQRCSFQKEGIPSECLPFVVSSSPYFLPPKDYNVTQQDILRQSTITALSLSPIKDTCRIPALRFACSKAFQPCSLHPLSPSLPNFFVFPLPQSPCQSVCQEMVRSCNKHLPSSALPDCLEFDDSTLEPLYPNKSSTYQVNGETYKVKCNIEAEHQKIGETTMCPKPLKLRNGGNPPCQLGCLSPIYSDDQWDALFQTTVIFGGITLACGLWVIICWVAQEKLRRFPANLAFFPVSGCVLVGLTWVISAIIGNKEIICIDEWTPGTTEGLCGVQGFLLLIGVLVNTFFFFLICLNLFLLVVLEVHLDRHKWYPMAVYGIGISFTLGFSVVIYAVEEYNFEISPFCFISTKDNFLWVLTFDYSWLVLFLAVNTIMTPIILWKLHQVRSRTGKSWRVAGMITFIFIFEIVLGIGASFMFYGISNKNEWKQGIEDEVICNANLGTNCGVKDSPFPFTMLTNTMWTLCGVWNLLSFANRWSIHKGGIIFLKMVFIDGNWRVILTGIKTSSGPSKSSIKLTGTNPSSSPSHSTSS